MLCEELEEKNENSNSADQNVSEVTNLVNDDYDEDAANSDNPECVDVFPIKVSRKKCSSRLKFVSYICEWRSCSQWFNKIDDYITHVCSHLPGDTSDACQKHKCYWVHCEFTACSHENLVTHALYHAFHTKLKALGATVLTETNLECKLDFQKRNLIPDIPIPFQCMWDNCSFQFLSAYHFYQHVASHVDILRASSPDSVSICFWQGCNEKMSTFYTLKKHMMAHTHEKKVACPVCGAAFCRDFLFVNHLLRQAPKKFQLYNCHQCKKSFASDHLLRDHLSHSKHVCCPACDIVCASSLDLLDHMKHIHETQRFFKCPECSSSFGEQYRLEIHMKKHYEPKPFTCYIKGCKSTFGTRTEFSNHLRRNHPDPNKYPYICHICNNGFKVSATLTKHLLKVHGFDQLPTASKFRYIKGPDGYFRFQNLPVDEDASCHKVDT